MKLLHLMTQDNQPFGSRRKCCEKCGLWEGTPGFLYVDEKHLYTKKAADSVGATLCQTATVWEG